MPLVSAGLAVAGTRLVVGGLVVGGVGGSTVVTVAVALLLGVHLPVVGLLVGHVGDGSAVVAVAIFVGVDCEWKRGWGRGW